jgi:hypothetical protein
MSAHRQVGKSANRRVSGRRIGKSAFDTLTL